MNPYLITLCAVIACWGFYQRSEASEAKGALSTLEASYSQTADKARADALAQEQKDTAALKLQSSLAIQSAQSHAEQSQRQLTAYQAKLKADAGMKDLGHVCSGVEIPKDLLP